MKKVVGIDVVEDRTAASRCDEGFLRLRRLRIANVYEDGTRSAPYACDVMTRRHADAVAVALYDEDAEGRVLVLLREGLRPPVTLRATRTDLVQPDARSWLLLPEVVAGATMAGMQPMMSAASFSSSEPPSLTRPMVVTSWNTPMPQVMADKNRLNPSAAPFVFLMKLPTVANVPSPNVPHCMNQMKLPRRSP